MLRPFEDSRFPIPRLGLLKTIGNFLNKATFTAAINSEQVGQFESLFKMTMNEQTAIASVLSDMDTEIAALAQRRDKTRAIKQGMMQQLLTGQVRLLK